ncbi:MAG: hypothetical protein QXO33_05250 [Nitrososphaeria archaeon]
MVLLVFVLWCEVGSAKEAFDCSQAGEVIKRVGEYFRGVNRSYFELEPREKEVYLSIIEPYFRAIRFCEKEVKKLIGYEDKSIVFFPAFRNTLDLLPEQKFSFVVISVEKPSSIIPILYEVFNPHPELFSFYPTAKVDYDFKKEKNLEKKNMCYLEAMAFLAYGYEPIVKCPYYRLEKNLSDEFLVVIKNEFYKGEDGKNYSKSYPIIRNENLKPQIEEEVKELMAYDIKSRKKYQYYMFHETIRTLINWLDKEFGERGRGLIKKK